MNDEFAELYLIVNKNDIRTFNTIPSALYPVIFVPNCEHVKIVKDNDGDIAILFHKAKNGEYIMYRVNPQYQFKPTKIVHRYRVASD